MATSTRRVELTVEGLALRKEVAPAVAAIVVVLERARDGTVPQVLSVMVSTDLSDGWAARVDEWLGLRGVPALSERRAPDEAMHLLRRGEIHLALIAGDIADTPASGIGYEPAVVVFPLEDRRAAQSAIRRGDFDDVPIIVADAGSLEQRRAAVDLLAGSPDAAFVVALRIATIAQGLVHSARTHSGAALVLERALERIDTAGLAIRPMDPPMFFPVTLRFVELVLLDPAAQTRLGGRQLAGDCRG